MVNTKRDHITKIEDLVEEVVIVVVEVDTVVVDMLEVVVVEEIVVLDHLHMVVEDLMDQHLQLKEIMRIVFLLGTFHLIVLEKI